ncbi:hypothetical protein CKAN_02687500 [Cinnamomum micranthum f. kanehirae]|uniref:Uncharacterized protein n=1 Tax=Cinnamomum micranthum f. kanehirae TaxID=337451 RepID=A0A3S3PB63_9MAGN|nr:hypothetical protein CKAN_02687500 [Cinnamomum micranthum f. kanehirae]
MALQLKMTIHIPVKLATVTHGNTKHGIATHVSTHRFIGGFSYVPATERHLMAAVARQPISAYIEMDEKALWDYERQQHLQRSLWHRIEPCRPRCGIRD